jgi:hypothetical protein
LVVGHPVWNDHISGVASLESQGQSDREIND